jgi:hypothetical protein
MVANTSDEDSAMLTSLLQAVGRSFCHHEWLARTDSNRLYVECMKCLATSDGIDLRKTRTPGPIVAMAVESHPLPSGQLAT